ncbi:hypothetical protein ACFSC4_31565 [Deinococcus malanensis]|uniref:hypothetical protein n=1 Tax=Deinococcus malanensis TaxID=1706855 RepID=UPI003627E783
MEPLSVVEQQDYERLKTSAQHGFTELAFSLREIITRKLYRQEYPNADAFCEAEFGRTRQWAYQLIDAGRTAETLSNFGLQLQNPKQAGEVRKAAQIIEKASPTAQQAFARVIQKITLTQRPDTMQINSVAEVIEQIDAAGVVEDPDTGEAVSVESLAPERLDAILRENVTTATYERVKRQEQHIHASIQARNSSGRGGWTNWCLSYAQQHLTDTQELRIVVKRDPSGNPKAQALVMDTETHQAVASGETADWLKKAVMNLVEEVNG